MNRPIIIAITGSIASGKSEVAQEIKKNGFRLYSTDQLGHDVLQIPAVKEQLLSKFGKQILNEQMDIERNKLSKIVFDNSDNLAYLNYISHPQIFNLMQNLVDNCSERYLFFEIPLLFETHLESHFDFIVTVTCSNQIQLSRLMLRNNLTEEEAKKKISSQLPNEIKEKKADFLIINNFSLTDLKLQVREFINSLPKIQYKKITSF